MTVACAWLRAPSPAARLPVAHPGTILALLSPVARLGTILPVALMTETHFGTILAVALMTETHFGTILALCCGLDRSADPPWHVTSLVQLGLADRQKN